MSVSVLTILPFTAAPVAAAVLGAVATAWRRPSPMLQGFVQHFAAGVIFAAGSAELLPRILHARLIGTTLAGAAVGVAVMLIIRFTSRKSRGPASLLAVVGLDVLVDGLVVALGFTAGHAQGVLLIIALTIELLFLGLAISSALGQAEPSEPTRTVAATVIIAMLMPAGAALGAAFFGGLPADMLVALYAFGLVALLYLVTEELLVEAHDRPESPLNAGVFFVGFFLMVVLDEMMK